MRGFARALHILNLRAGFSAGRIWLAGYARGKTQNEIGHSHWPFITVLSNKEYPMTCLKFQKLIAFAALLAMASAMGTEVQAQQANTDPSQPVQIISNAQFNQMVESGQLMPATPPTILGQGLQQLFRDFANRAVIDEFIRQNPNLPGFAEMVYGTPTAPNVQQTLGGSYGTVITLNNGATQTIRTNGPSAKLAQLANSIVTSSDPVHELNVYQMADMA
jgi:hypothetical protein